MRMVVALQAVLLTLDDGSGSILRTLELILGDLRDLPNKLIAKSLHARLEVQGGNG